MNSAANNKAILTAVTKHMAILQKLYCLKLKVTRSTMDEHGDSKNVCSLHKKSGVKLILQLDTVKNNTPSTSALCYSYDT